MSAKKKKKPGSKWGENLRAEGAPYRWKPGQSGNPAGRPKLKLISEALRTGLEEIPAGGGGRTIAEIIAHNILKRALDEQEGRPDAELALDRTEGKAPQHIDFSGDFTHCNMTKEQIVERILELVERGRSRGARPSEA
jgi:hypothetical protein